jgi:hypothetical protein
LLFQNDETNNIIEGLIYLEKDKNIIMKVINKTSQISIYNDLFNEEKIKLKFNYSINDYLKLTKNLFVISIYQKIKIISIMNEDFIDEEIKIDELEITFIDYNKKEKILFSMGNRMLYLINFNCMSPEVVQKIIIKNYFEIKYRYYFSEKESIYFHYSENLPFYRTAYLVQFKIINGELKIISKIEIFKEKNILNLK